MVLRFIFMGVISLEQLSVTEMLMGRQRRSGPAGGSFRRNAGYMMRHEL
jgi:hypothetical protein